MRQKRWKGRFWSSTGGAISNRPFFDAELLFKSSAVGNRRLFDLEWNALENDRLVAMTLEEISDYCRLRDCQVRLGSSDTGFILVSSGGLESSNNYGRFLALSELRGLPSPARVVRQAELFRVDGPEGSRDLNREAFEQELGDLLREVGLR